MKFQIESPSGPVAPLHTGILQSLDWKISHTLVVPARPGKWTSAASLGLTAPALKLASSNPQGIHTHQELALRTIQGGCDTAVATGTGSGKSLVFQVAATEVLARDPHACVLVLYPMRALAEEQYDRWVKALETAGVDSRASLFIGDGLSTAQRLKEIASARVIVSSPDVVHAWLMQHRNTEKAIRTFLKRLRLLAIDEAHAYTAVFGSQSAFLFRRLDHAVRVLGSRFQVVAASATMADPVNHLHSLTGRDFNVIGIEYDSSPSHEKSIHFVSPTPDADLISGLGTWFRHCTDAKAGNFLAFVESRVQAEHFARGAGRRFSADNLQFAIKAQSGQRPAIAIFVPCNCSLAFPTSDVGLITLRPTHLYGESDLLAAAELAVCELNIPQILLRRVLAHTLAAISLWDTVLAQELASEGARSVLNPLEALKAYGLRLGWKSNTDPSQENGALSYIDGDLQVHSAHLAISGKYAQIAQRLYRPQAAILLPWVEEQRLALIERSRAFMEGATTSDLELMEIGEMSYNLKFSEAPRDLWERANSLRVIRNAIAHRQTLSLSQLQNIR